MPTGKVHVLVIESDEVNAEVARTMLERLGCRVDVAENGADGVDLFSEETYDLLLMAWRMPVMDGLEATARIRSLPQGQAARIVGTSAGIDRTECLSAGMNDLMPKPFQIDRLKQTLSKWTRWQDPQLV
jgi:CheY-like chemotaxis protein